jgi:hypothetical protein
MFSGPTASKKLLWQIVGISCALILGVGLRLVWPGDMEYKADEIYSFERTQRVGVSEPFPWTGMSNSADVPHPGMSVWVFIGLAKLVGAHDPVQLNMACMALNVFALGLLAVFIARVIPSEERESWWWALALACVNPLAVLFHRKIWPPSVMPPITVALLAAWWYRDRKLGAFAFGFLAIIAAQIHPGAFFFTAGMGLWALLYDRAGVRWLSGLAGGCLGSIPAWPWLYHLLFIAERSASAKAKWWHLVVPKFWYYWITEPFGFDLEYSLGHNLGDFLRWPIVGGHPTYFVAVLQAVLATTMIAIVGRWLWRVARERGWNINRGPSAFTLAAVVGGYGLLLTITGLPVYRHYMIITFPLMFVWVAQCAFAEWRPAKARAWLGTTCVAQALISVLFLAYIHAQEAPIRGDYGAPLRLQRQIHDQLAARDNR